MVSKSEIKLIQSLRLKKFRQKYNLFVAEGEKTVRTLLTHQSFSLYRLYAISDRFNDISLRVNTSLVKSCTKEELKKLSSLSSTPSVLGVFEFTHDADQEKKLADWVIYLDDIQDPGNLGTIIRIADWYGVGQVIRSEGSADFYNPKVVQATMGSMGHVDLLTIPKADFKVRFNRHLKVGASMTASDRIETLPQRICLVIGNEGKGMSEEISRDIDHHLHIAGAHHKVADSLNASVATGIICERLFGE